MSTLSASTDRLIVAIDDDAGFLEATADLLNRSGYRAITADGGRKGLALLGQHAGNVSLVLLDMRMPEMDGQQTLEQIVRSYPTVPVIMLTGENAIDLVVRAMKAGASNYISKGVGGDELLATVRAAVEQARGAHSAPTDVEHYRQYGVIGRSPALGNLLANAQLCADSNLSILVTGETGVGKDVVANAIHRMSNRSAQPFVTVDVPNIPATMFESELFGYKRGAFTGATDNKPGLLQAASGGTLFLDEIGEFPIELQPKFLRVLENNSVRRLGSVTTEAINVRFVSATNRDLLEAVRDRVFREDLLYRLRGIELHIPPLRERRQDIAPLAVYFLERFLKKGSFPMKRLSPAAIELLERQWWHGNARELLRTVEAAALLTPGETIAHTDVGRVLEQSGGATRNSELVVVQTYDDVQTLARHTKKDELVRVLDRNNWNITRAAAELDIDRSTLSKQMKSLGIVKPRIRL